MKVVAAVLALVASQAMAWQDVLILPSQVEKTYQTGAGPLVLRLESTAVTRGGSTSFSVRYAGATWEPDEVLLREVAFFADGFSNVTGSGNKDGYVWLSLEVRDLRPGAKPGAQARLTAAFRAGMLESVGLEIRTPEMIAPQSIKGSFRKRPNRSARANAHTPSFFPMIAAHETPSSIPVSVAHR